MTKRNQKTQALQAQAFSPITGRIAFEVSEQEWRAELPAKFDCYSLPLREYQFRAIFKKAASIIGSRPLSYGLNIA